MSRRMKKKPLEYANVYQGKALIADPIHQYASFTVPLADFPSEQTEKDLLDSPWLQRLRRIGQLQSARWVYPAAEHSRFQHSIGTMHVAGEFGKTLYQSLCDVCRDAPSSNHVEELLRLAGLLHDVGHGPYGHFFDDHFLNQYRLTHEVLGQQIIIRKLGRMIRQIQRSPTGPFAPGESLDPRHIAYLIRMPGKQEDTQPRWLQLLRQLFSGIYTVDNLDYVQRDAYMTGFSLDMVDIARLRFYSFFTRDGLTLHQAGISALNRFLNARLNLYTNVYFHRTTRALDLHLQEIFRDTLNLILPGNPLEHLNDYLACDEWCLFHEVRQWPASPDQKKRKLGREWENLYNQQVKWKMSFSTEISVDQLQRGMIFSTAGEYERQLRKHLPDSLKKMDFRVDLATQDPRPLNPMAQTEKRVNIYNPMTGMTSPEPLHDLYRYIPARVVHFRVFSHSHQYDAELSRAAEKTLSDREEGLKTNV